MGAWLTLQKHASSHTCYHTKFGRFRSNRVGVSIGVPRIWGTLGFRPLGIGAWLSPYKYAFPHEHELPCTLCQMWSFYHTVYERNYGNPPEKFDPSRSAFLVYSRSSKTTGIDRLYLGLPIIMIHIVWPYISYRFRY